MTEYEARVTVNQLNHLFNCTPCGLAVRPHLEYGRRAYYNGSGVIFLSYKGLEDKQAENIVLHEFAHHLVYLRRRLQNQLKGSKLWIKETTERFKAWDFGEAKKQTELNAPLNPPTGKKKERRVHHGKDFITCLKVVIGKYYKGDLGKYTLYEYRRVAKALQI